MLTEITIIKYRGKCIVVINFFITFGKLWGCLLAFLCLENFNEGNWRLMMRLSCIPAVLACFLIYFFLDESPRYLMLVKEYE